MCHSIAPAVPSGPRDHGAAWRKANAGQVSLDQKTFARGCQPKHRPTRAPTCVDMPDWPATPPLIRSRNTPFARSRPRAPNL
jgi:hypothetical protein